MTKEECRNEITRNQQLIAQYNGQIATLQREIQELQTTQSKVEGLHSNLSGCKSSSVTKLASTSGLGKINDKIVNGFYEGMDNLFNGNRYTSVSNGLDTAIARVASEIAKKNGEIATCQQNIASCNSRIDQMNGEISRIEAEEAAERERQERERQEREKAERERKERERKEKAKTTSKTKKKK